MIFILYFTLNKVDKIAVCCRFKIEGEGDTTNLEDDHQEVINDSVSSFNVNFTAVEKFQFYLANIIQNNLAKKISKVF